MQRNKLRCIDDTAAAVEKISFWPSARVGQFELSAPKSFCLNSLNVKLVVLYLPILYPNSHFLYRKFGH